MKKGYCECCLREMQTPNNYEHNKHIVLCSVRCTIIISLFNQFYSDKEFKMREHYNYNFSGEGNGQ